MRDFRGVPGSYFYVEFCQVRVVEVIELIFFGQVLKFRVDPCLLYHSLNQDYKYPRQISFEGIYMLKGWLFSFFFNSDIQLILKICLCDFDLIMETEYCQHELSQRLKISLFQTFKNPCYGFDISGEGYFLRQTEEGTQLVLHDDQFQNITKAISVESIWSPQNFILVKTSETILAVQGFGATISVTKIDGQSSRTEQTIPIQPKDQIVFISNSISMKDCILCVSLTRQGQFNLIALKKNGGWEVTKLDNLQDIDSSIGFFQLFSKRTQNFSHFNMHLFKIDKYERFIQLLVIRDSRVTLHLLQLHIETKKSTISLIREAPSLQPSLNSQRTICQSIFKYDEEEQFRQMSIFLACEIRHNFVQIVKITLNSSSKSMFSAKRLIENIRKDHFSFAVIHGQIVHRNFNSNSSRFEVFRNKIYLLQKSGRLKLQDSIPSMVFEECPHFKVSDSLYIVSEKEVFAILKEEEESDFSHEQKRWINFKYALNNIYFKKIHNLSEKSLQTLIQTMNQKEQVIVCWMKEEAHSLSQEDLCVKEIFELQIICIKTVIILSQCFLTDGVETLKSQIFEAAANCEPSSIQDLITSLMDKNNFTVFFHLVSELKRYKDIYADGLKVIFFEPFQRISEDFQNRELPKSIYLSIISKLACFNVVQKRHLDLLNIEEDSSQIIQIIINHQLKDVFIQYLLSSDLQFTSKELNRLLKFESTLKIKQFVTHLLKNIRDIRDREKLLRLIPLLVQGLLPFHDDILYEIDQLLPGLNLFILMKRGQRRKVIELMQMNPFFRSIYNKNFLYLLISDILYQKASLDEHFSLLVQTIFGSYHPQSKEINEKEGINQGKRQKELSEITEFEKYPSKKRKQ